MDRILADRHCIVKPCQKPNIYAKAIGPSDHNQGLPGRKRSQQLDSNGQADESGHAAMGDGRGEEDGDGIVGIVHLCR